MNKRRKPFNITEWSKKQLTKGNDIFSRSIMALMCIAMVTFVLIIGGVLPPITEANASTIEAEEVAMSSPVITIPVKEAEFVAEETVVDVDESVSPVILAGSASTVSLDEEILNIQPHDDMEVYDTDVYVSHQGGLNIRSLPDTENGQIVGMYNYKDKVHVMKRGDGWLYTDDGNYIYESSTSTEEPPSLKYLGKFKTTAYCTCAKCCNPKYKGLTAIGKRPVEGRSIAVDPKVIPLRSKVVINGHEYTAEDTGNMVKGKVIDFYMTDHSRALKHGVRYMDVYVYQ